MIVSERERGRGRKRERERARERQINTSSAKPNFFKEQQPHETASAHHTH